MLHTLSAEDYIDPVTFLGGPISHSERKALLESINQYVPLKKMYKCLTTNN